MRKRKSYERAICMLSEIEGYGTIMEMLEEAVCDSVVPAICVNEGCEYSTGMEPDQTMGWCEECSANTVKSCLVLAGVI